MESTKIDPAGCSTPRDTGLWKDDFIPQLKRITELVKRTGSVIALQLGHSGRKARRSVPWEGRVPMRLDSTSSRSTARTAISSIISCRP